MILRSNDSHRKPRSKRLTIPPTLGDSFNRNRAAICRAATAVEGCLPGGIGVERLREPPTEWSRQFEALGLYPE
jgi:hypothetical protein